MIQVKNIFTHGLMMQASQKNIGRERPLGRRKSFLELRPRFNEQNRTNLLSSFLPEERLTDEVQRGIRVLATERWNTMTDDDKLSSMNYFLEFNACRDGNRRSKKGWSLAWSTSFIISIPPSNDMYLGVKINLILSNSGALRWSIKVLNERDWDDLVNWNTLSGFEHIPQWNEDAGAG